MEEEEEEIVEGEEQREEEEESKAEQELNASKNASQEINWEFDEEDFPHSDPMMKLEIASLPAWEIASLTATSLPAMWLPAISLPAISHLAKSLPAMSIPEKPYLRPDSPDSGIDAGELEDFLMSVVY